MISKASLRQILGCILDRGDSFDLKVAAFDPFQACQERGFLT